MSDTPWNGGNCLTQQSSTFFGTRDRFHGRQFFSRKWRGWGGWFQDDSSSLHLIYDEVIV